MILFFNFAHKISNSAALAPVMGLALLCVLLFSGRTVYAYGETECSSSRFGSDLVCTAGDVSITGIAVAPGSPTSCIGGSTFNVDLDVTVNFATPDRWDIGIFLSNDGNDPQLLPGSGGASSCSVDILPTASPFLDLDPNGGLDTCGDGNSSINGGLGYGVVRLHDVPVSCRAIEHSGGNLYIPFVVSWDNQASPSGLDCTSKLDPVPNTKSKCNAPDISNPVEVAYGTVNAVVLPTISKTDGVSTVNPGDSLTYTVLITNTTGQPLSGAVVSDPATPNLTVNSLSCSAAGGATCPTTSIPAMQGSGLALPDMPVGSSITFTLNATVNDPIDPSYQHLITNTALVTVSGETNWATDSDTINGAVYSDLSTSTKSVVDLNGGEAEPGDILRYTITLNETAGHAVTGASVSDDIPPYTSNFSLVSIPDDVIDNSTGSGSGAHGTGLLDIGSISLDAYGSSSIVFDVTIANGTPAGTGIDNGASISNPGGPGAEPAAETIVVSPSAVPRTDNKKLYLYSTAPNTLSRTMPAATPANIPFTNAAPVIWNGNSPLPLQQDNTVAAAYASLYLSADTTQARQVEARMYCSASPTAYATSGFYDLGTIPTTPTLYTFNLTTLVGGFSFPATCAAPGYWVLRVDSNTNKNVTVHPTSGADFSRLNLDSSNVIYVENLAFHDLPYPAGTTLASVSPGTTLYIRSLVSDPFGSFDISAATIEITDPDGTPVVSGAAMSEVADSGAATKTYEYAYTVPLGAPTGNWTVTVTAREGTEGTVTDDRISAFEVFAFPSLTILKTVETLTEPVNGTTNPKAIPGAELLYRVQVINSGFGSPDSDTLEVTDPIPANTSLYVGDLGQGAPLFFSDIASSGFTAGDVNLSYSEDASCSDYNYTPSADTDGFDSNVCAFKARMTGTFNASDGTTNPSFSLEFKVRID